MFMLEKKDFKITYLSFCLNMLEKEEKIKLSKRKEIVKTRAEINERKRQRRERINKVKFRSLKRLKNPWQD